MGKRGIAPGILMGKSTPGRGAAQQGWIVLAELPLHVTEDVRSSSTFLAFWNRRQTPTLGVVCRQIAKQIQYIGHVGSLQHLPSINDSSSKLQ
jgi:hypothetical protein